MIDQLSFSLVTFSAIFFVVDPFAVIPLFLSMTQGDPPKKRSGTALKAAVASTVTLLVFACAGGMIFRLFGITMGAFRIAGGLLLFLMALDMMRAQRSRVRTSPEEESEGAARDDIAIIPLAIPMLAGPGAIATVTVIMSKAQQAAQVAIVIGSVLATGVLTFLLLRAATVLERTLRQTGLNILNRIMGLILAAVAVQFVVSGIADVVPQIIDRIRTSPAAVALRVTRDPSPVTSHRWFGEPIRAEAARSQTAAQPDSSIRIAPRMQATCERFPA